MRRVRVWGGPALALTLALLVMGCGAEPDDGADAQVTTRGSVEVTARLVDVPGEFPSNDLYDYAYVMKYEVRQTHRGEAPKTILVGHYNPLKPRAEAADERSGDIGGNAIDFREGEWHRMALELPIEDYCMAGIINEYAEDSEDSTEPIYWAVWTNRVVP